MSHCNNILNNHSVRAALYARVSSEQQAQAGTIASQIAAVLQRAREDQLCIEPEAQFIDEGHSGATLVRPALERLRDLAATGGIDRLYVLCPDRLARSYAYQVLLVDELQRCGVEVVFVNRELGKTPEDHLLLQVQGMVAEYERAKIIERSRRGKLHAARRGSVNVLSGAPYGYRYVSGIEGAGAAQYNVHLQQAAVVRRIFQWVGAERLSIGQVCKRLKNEGISSPRGKDYWDRSTVWGVLKNPAYKGQAAFGKTHMGPMRPRLRGGRRRHEQPRNGQSCFDAPAEQWINIAVPAIVEEEMFDAVAQQLEENRRRSRQGRRGARYLLQGLLVCKCCGYAYYGKQISLSGGKGKRRDYGYYRCVGTDAYRFGGHRVCPNKQVRQDILDYAVWNDVRSLLSEPGRIEQELDRRLDPDRGNPQQQMHQKLSAQMDKLRRGIARLIDAYGEGLVDKSEFEPRIKSSKERLSQLQEQLQSHLDEQARARELRLVIDNLEMFAKQVAAGLDQADWTTRRDVIRTLVKRVEIDKEQVKVVYRVDLSPFDRSPERGFLHYCWRGEHAALWRPLLASAVSGRIPRAIARFNNHRLEPHPNQLQHRSIHDPLPHGCHQLLVGDGVEVRLQIRIVYFPAALLEIEFDLLQRIVRRSSRPESIRTVKEVRLEDRFHDQQHRRLHHAVFHRRDAQWAIFAVGFGDVHTLNRLRAVGPGLERLFDLAQESPHAVFAVSHLVDAHTVHARRSIVGGHLFPRRKQNIGPMDSVIQRVKPKPRLSLGFEV
jgi:site-specific DNA recombinase